MLDIRNIELIKGRWFDAASDKTISYEITDVTQSYEITGVTQSLHKYNFYASPFNSSSTLIKIVLQKQRTKHPIAKLSGYVAYKEGDLQHLYITLNSIKDIDKLLKCFGKLC